jgi:hypothetical protein
MLYKDRASAALGHMSQALFEYKAHVVCRFWRYHASFYKVVTFLYSVRSLACCVVSEECPGLR